MGYDEALALQRAARELLLERTGAPDVVFTVEHPPVLTAGKRALDSNLRRSPAALMSDGVAVRHVERGGDWTYHGPGQLVAYLIVDLRRRGLRVKDFVGGLEDLMIGLATTSLAQIGVDAGFERRRGHPGAWVREAGPQRRKVGAVGVHVSHGVTLHGLALNIDPRPWGFDWIVPCGIADAAVVSLASLAAERDAESPLPSVAELAEALIARLPAQLDRARRVELSACSAG